MTQRKIFTSTPCKRTYLWNTGHTTQQSQKYDPKTISDANSAASRVYRIVLWSSEDAESKSKKKKRSPSTMGTSKKNQKENKILNNQNLNENKSPKISTLKDNDKTNLIKPTFTKKKMLKEKQNKNEESNSQNFNEDSSLKIPCSGTNVNDKEETHENLSVPEKNKDKNKLNKKRAKYKFEVNKEVQKLFTQQFNDKRKSPNQPKGKNTSPQKVKPKDLVQKFCPPTSQERIDADATFDIWNLSEDSNQNNNTTNTTNNNVNCIHQTRIQKSKRNMIHGKADFTRKDNSISSTNKKCIKNNAIKSKSVTNSTVPASCTQKASLTAKSSKKIPSSDNNVSQVYEFPTSPTSTDKEKSKIQTKKKKSRNLTKKKNSNMKNNLKNALAVDQILKVISQTKIEMESLRKTPQKQSRKMIAA